MCVDRMRFTMMKSIAYLLYVFVCVTRADKSAVPLKGDSSNLRGSLFQSLLKDHPALLEKLNAHPDVVQFLQTHPELAEKVKADPSVLDRFLAAREAKNAGKAVDKESKNDPTALKDDKKKSKKDSAEKEEKKAAKKDQEQSIISTTEDSLAKDDTTEQGGVSENSLSVSTEDAGKAVDNESNNDPTALKDEKKKSKKDSAEKEEKKAAKKDKKHSRKSKSEDSLIKTEQDGVSENSITVSTEDASTATTSNKEEPESRRLDAKDKALDFVMSHPDTASYRATSTSHHPRSSPKVDGSYMMARPVIVATPKSHQDLVDKVRMHPEIMQRLTIDKMMNEKIIH